MCWKRSKGFTLLELLIALGILSLVLAILYKSFAAMIDTTEKVEEETEIYRMARLALTIMTDELRSAYWNKDQSSTFFTGTDEQRLGQPADSLRFTALSRHRYGEETEGPELAALRYGLETAPFEEREEPRLVLLHEEETNLLSLSADSLQLTELGEMVWGLNLRYMEQKPSASSFFEGAEGGWVDSWDAGEKKKLPWAVEIRLIFKDRQGQEYEFFTRTEIPIATSG
jgi:prepilin-type N-terminal cleavage/methylation domain-containing protein